MDETFSLYGGKVTLRQDRWHRYFLTCKSKKIEDVRVEGVTTPLNRIAKDFLVPWAAKMAVKDLGYYDRDQWNDGTKKYDPIPEALLVEPHKKFLEMHSKIKLMNPEQLYSALKEAKGAHRRAKDDAADLGTLGHAWVENLIKYRINVHKVKTGEVLFAKRPYPGYDSMPEIPAYPVLQNTAGAFLKWEAEHHVIFTESEQRIASLKHLYAGTEDFEAIVDGELTSGDLKTSNHISVEYRFQTAAYNKAREEEFKGRKYGARLVIRVGKDLVKDPVTGKEVVEFEAQRYGRETLDRDFNVFLGALAIDRGMKEIEALEKQSKT